MFGRIEQTCLRLEEMPKVLLPTSNSNGTVKPIKGPETYQGQGCLRKDNISVGGIKISIGGIVALVVELCQDKWKT